MATIKNTYLTIQTKANGAELTSLKSNKTGVEYLWQADPEFWARHAPVLFPFVGKSWQDTYRTSDGSLYKMPQHGFARDMHFVLFSQDETSIMYLLKSNTETLEKYPYHFELYIGYRLNKNMVEVIWEVKNTGKSEMYFQIGAHPAFNYIDFDSEAPIKGYLGFDKQKDITYKLIGEKGCLNVQNRYDLDLQEGLLAIKANTFAKDALVIEANQIKTVKLLDRNKQQHIALHFDAPVVGLWSPNKENAPFVCIEPWYGRCDKEHFEGIISQKDWINKLNAAEKFSTRYIIEVDSY